MVNIKKLKEIMEKGEMTYRDVTLKTGINLKTLWGILNDQLKPRPKTIRMIEEGLGLKKGALKNVE